MEKIERRLTFSTLELRGEGDEPRQLVGHAAVFNMLSEDLGGFREMIKPGAFQKSLGDDVRALINHETRLVLGRTTAKTLEISEDERGLLSKISPPDTSYARDLAVSIKRGDVTQMSFAFRVRAGGQDWSEDENGQIIRTLTDLQLYEVSPVTFPAYPQTDVASRSLEEWRHQRRNRGSVTRRRLEHEQLKRGIAR